jgi:hypothetical protein
MYEGQPSRRILFTVWTRTQFSLLFDFLIMILLLHHIKLPVNDWYKFFIVLSVQENIGEA